MGTHLISSFDKNFYILQSFNMFTRYATAALALCAGASAAPLADLAKRQGQNIDVTVLQFALTLEHLENVFYRQAVNKFDAHDFEKAAKLVVISANHRNLEAYASPQASPKITTTT